MSRCSLGEARVQLQERLREMVGRAEVLEPLALELEQAFVVLRDYAFFVDYQRKELEALCRELVQ